MAFFAGDILIKIDYRSTADTRFTRHHVMLVLGESPNGNPFVAHLMAGKHCKLVYEELNRGKELILIRYAWSDAIKIAIHDAAMASLQQNKFILTDEIIQKQRDDVSCFRSDCSLESGHKMKALEGEFEKLEKSKADTFTPHPKEITIISCHEWVLSVIHYACRITQTPIPGAFRIPPHLAWADCLYRAAIQDQLVKCITINLPYHQVIALENRIQMQKKISKTTGFCFSFFSNWITSCVLDNAIAAPTDDGEINNTIKRPSAYSRSNIYH